MKKVIVILVCLVVIGVVVQKSKSSEWEEVLERYDEALVKYQKVNDYKSAYYELNCAFNDIISAGVNSSSDPVYTTEQISQIGNELDKRVDTLLTKLEEKLPGGIENDWSSVDELRNRYKSFYQKRVAILNRDKAARKQTELVIKLRGLNAPEKLPEQGGKISYGGDNVSKSVRSKDPRSSRNYQYHMKLRYWQSWAQNLRNVAMGLSVDESCEINSFNGKDVLIITKDNVEEIIEESRPEKIE